MSFPGLIDVTDSAFAGGAKFDFQIALDGAMAANDDVLTCASASFVSGDVGKTIAVEKADTDGHITTISDVLSSTQIRLASPNQGAAFTGSKVNWGTDDTAALNDAFAAVGKGAEVRFPAGYSGATSINATGQISTRIFGVGGANNQGAGAIGSVILPLSKTAALLDMCGSLGYVMGSFQLGHEWAAATGCVGWFQAPTTDFQGSNAGTVIQVPVGGKWKKGAVYFYRVETGEFYGCSFWNDKLGAPGAYFGGVNDQSVSSIYKTILTGAGGCGDYTFIGGGIALNLKSLAGTSGDTAPALVLRDTGQFRFFGTKFVCSNSTGHIAAFNSSGRNPSIIVPACHFYSETPPVHAGRNFYVDGGCDFHVTADAATRFEFSTSLKHGAGVLRVRSNSSYVGDY